MELINWDNKLKNNIVEPPQYENGRLCWFGGDLSRAADQFGTPLHIGAAGAVEEAFRAFRLPFEQAKLPLSVYYSVKTNPLSIYLDQLQKLGCGFETVSRADLYLLSSLGVPARQIIHTGEVNAVKQQGYALHNLKMITLATQGQVMRLAERTNRGAPPISVGLTINPNLWQGYWNITLNTSRKGSPLGFHPESDLFDEVVQTITRHPSLSLTGLQMHLGSGIPSGRPYVAGIKVMEEAALKLIEQRHTIRLLDIGGGFALPTAPTMKIRNMVTSLLGLDGWGNKSAEAFTYLDTVAQQLVQTKQKLKNQGIELNEIAAEPGRLLSGPCQLLILTVQDVVARNKRKCVIFCDAGAMSLSPMLLTEQHAVLPLVNNGTVTQKYEVQGVLPSALDRVAATAELPEMSVGDRIAVQDTGAYFLPMNNRFSGPLPPVAWIQDGKVRLARTAEQMEDLQLRDFLP